MLPGAGIQRARLALIVPSIRSSVLLDKWSAARPGMRDTGAGGRLGAEGSRRGEDCDALALFIPWHDRLGKSDASCLW